LVSGLFRNFYLRHECNSVRNSN